MRQLYVLQKRKNSHFINQIHTTTTMKKYQAPEMKEIKIQRMTLLAGSDIDNIIIGTEPDIVMDPGESL